MMFFSRKQKFSFVLLCLTGTVSPLLAQDTIPKCSWDEITTAKTPTTKIPTNVQRASSNRTIPAPIEIDNEDVPYDLRSIYQQANSARSIPDFTKVIEAGKNLLNDSGRSSTERNYLRSLLGWAANKRGELRSDLAGEKVQLQQVDQAAELDRLAMLDFKFAVENDSTRWRAHHNLGIALALAGNTQDAIECFESTIRLNPKFTDAYNNLGEMQFKTGKYADAVKNYSKAIQMQPEDSRLFSSRAHAQFAAGKTAEALEDYETAMKMAPEAADAVIEYADTCQALGKWKEAAEAYQKAMRLDPDNGRALQNAAWMMATCPDEFYRDGNAATKTATHAVESFGAEPTAQLLDVLAAAQACKGDFKSAVTTINQAIQRTDDATFRKELNARRALYQKKRPFVQVASK